MHQDDFAPMEAVEVEFDYPGIYDPGILVQFSIYDGEGQPRPFLRERHPTIELAQERLMDLAQNPYDNGMKENEDIVFQVIPDA